MAIYHASLKPMSRSSGRSVASAIAYRSGESIHDPRTGLTWKYEDKNKRIKSSDVFLPEGVDRRFKDKNILWGDIEKHHKRKDAVPAFEIEVALPHELSDGIKIVLANKLAKYIAREFQVPAEADVHTSDGVGGNWHSHITFGACKIGAGGLGEKQYLFDQNWCFRNDQENFAQRIRPVWEKMVNEELETYLVKSRVNHKSLKDQGIERLPQVHRGPKQPREREKTDSQLQYIRDKGEIFLINSEIKSYELLAKQFQEEDALQLAKERIEKGGTMNRSPAEEKMFSRLLDFAESNYVSNGKTNYDSGLYYGIKEAYGSKNLNESIQHAKEVYIANGKTDFDSGIYEGLKISIEELEKLNEREVPSKKKEIKQDDLGW